MSVEELLKKAESGDSEAMYKLGTFYFDEYCGEIGDVNEIMSSMGKIGDVKKFDLATMWFKKSSVLGNYKAQTMLISMVNGHIKRNMYDRALSLYNFINKLNFFKKETLVNEEDKVWYLRMLLGLAEIHMLLEEARDLDLCEDYLNRALQYEKEINDTNKSASNYIIDAINDCIDKDNYDGMFFFSNIGASHGIGGAQYNLGCIYKFGLGNTDINPQKAFYWFEQAIKNCPANDIKMLGNAKLNLGVCYYEGFGTSVNKEKAQQLYKESAELGNENAKDNLINNSKKSSDNSKNSGCCYVATCIYGSYDCPEVWTLRRFRDNTLKHLWFGKIFIKLYYTLSPKAVKLFGNKKWFNKLFTFILNKLVYKLQNNGVDNNPYSDI